MKAGYNLSSDKLLKKGKGWNPFLLVILSFAIVIVVGTFLLFMPFSQKSGTNMTLSNFVDCLFTAVSATCVTGLCTFSNGIGDQLTFFGQLIVLILIQIGGLGFITVLSFIMTIFNKKISFKNRNFLFQAVGSTSFGNVVAFVRKIIFVVFIIETIGTACLLPVFFQVPGTTTLEAIWRSIFHCVSSFNNAGFDILGNTSLLRNGEILNTLPDWTYNYLLSVTMILIVLGGISFIVIFEAFSKKKPKQWKAFTKVVLLMTSILLIGGFIIFVCTEGFKGENSMSPMDALFQSVTCRTAGFLTYNQSDLTIGGRILSCFLMFVGGAPLGTAGGVKVTTIFMVAVALNSYVTGREVHSFKRTYSNNTIIKALVLLAMAFVLIVICYAAVASIETKNENITSSMLLFECVSAFGTVGLSQNCTPLLHSWSKIVIMLLMFLGRLGPMTLFQVIQNNLNNKSSKSFSYVEEDFLIG